MRTRLALPAALAAALLAPAGAAAGTKFKTLPHPRFGFAKQGFDATTRSRLAALQRLYKPTPMLSIALGDAPNHTAPVDRNFAALGGAADGFAGGFGWDYADETLREGKPWYPQGITGTADANPAGSLGGHKIIVVSWYQRRTPSDDTSVSSRITIVTADSLAHATYRHVLLVRMTGRSGFTTTPSHAGGVAWVGNYVYVADTTYGLRVYDIRHILKVPKRSRAAVSHTYKYIMPQVGAYRLRGTARPHISSLSVDRTTNPVSLVTSEYVDGAPKGYHGKMGRWSFSSPTGALVPGLAVVGYREPDTNVQGATSIRGTLLTAASAGSGAGRLTRGAPDASIAQSSWAVGGESLTYAAGTNRIYTVTEPPNYRAVFAYDATRLGF